MRHYEIPTTLPRSSSGQSTTSSAFLRTTSSLDFNILEEFHNQAIVCQGSPGAASFHRVSRNRGGALAVFRRVSRNHGGAIAAFLRSILSIFTFPAFLPTCRWLGTPSHFSITPALGRKVTGTLFGHRRGAISFAVQYDPRSVPVFLIEFAVSTAALVKEMSHGLLRIALECEKPAARPRGGGKSAARLFGEPMWTMYCNGRQCGHAQARECNDSDRHVLSTVQSVSVGAGVIPVVDDGRKKGGKSEGELVYMRARFERVVGNRDSEAFYMLNPDGNGGPELGIFLLRI